MKLIEISVKSGKDSTSTLSLVIHRVRFFKNLQKCTLESKVGMKLRKPSISKVRKRQYQYPEFGHTQGEIF
jgi:hypothetical protein